MKNTVKMIIASLLLFILASCSQLIPTVEHHPAREDESEAETVSEPILSIRFWVPYGGVPRELVEMHQWNGRVVGYYDGIFYEDELQTNETIIVRPQYATVDEFLSYETIAEPNMIMMTCEYDGPINTVIDTEYNDYLAFRFFPFEAEGLQLIKPCFQTVSSNEPLNHEFTKVLNQSNCLQTGISMVCDPEELFYGMTNAIEQAFCSREYLNDVLETPIPEFYEIWRIKDEVTVIISAIDFKTQQVCAKAEVKITWHGSWECLTALDHITKDETSPYYKKPHGAVHYLYNNIGLENCPYYTIEMVDYWQVE